MPGKKVPGTDGSQKRTLEPMDWQLMATAAVFAVAVALLLKQ